MSRHYFIEWKSISPTETRRAERKKKQANGTTNPVIGILYTYNWQQEEEKRSALIGGNFVKTILQNAYMYNLLKFLWYVEKDFLLVLLRIMKTIITCHEKKPSIPYYHFGLVFLNGSDVEDWKRRKYEQKQKA